VNRERESIENERQNLPGAVAMGRQLCVCPDRADSVRFLAVFSRYFINLNPIGQFLYAGAVSWLGNLLFDDPFCGDNVLGLLMFLLTVMLYSVIAGTGLYLFRRYVSRETN